MAPGDLAAMKKGREAARPENKERLEALRRGAPRRRGYHRAGLRLVGDRLADGAGDLRPRLSGGANLGALHRGRVTLVNLVVDLGYGVLNPRVRAHVGG
jgi:hypothetical protein